MPQQKGAVMRLAIADVAATRQLEGRVMAPVDLGYPQLLLMERAALSMATLVRRLATPHAPIIVLAGSGNNGGDGIALARIMKGWGFAPQVYLLQGGLTEATTQQLQWAKAWGVAVSSWTATVRLPDGAVLIDAIFGFGLNRAPEGEAAQAIQAINACKSQAVVALDLPSGLDGSNGTAPGAVVKATHTVAAGIMKTGLLCDPALDHIGELYVGDIGFPRALLADLPGEIILPQPLPPRRRACHKGEAGSLLIVGGAAAMSGAPAMAALAAGRIGAGLVYVAVPASIREAVASLMPEAVVVPMAPDHVGDWSATAWSELQPLLARCDAGILGPGMGLGKGARAIANHLNANWDRPLVMDADVLRPEVQLDKAAGPRLLTPHPGEMGRLLSCSSGDIQHDRLQRACEGAARLGHLLVLKGARTIVADPSGRYGINVCGHPAMATAGAGDVLAGVIGGLLAQGMSPWEAASQGVALHGLAGERAVKSRQMRSLLATDLLQHLQEVIAHLPNARPAVSELIHLASYVAGQVGDQ